MTVGQGRVPVEGAGSCTGIHPTLMHGQQQPEPGKGRSVLFPALGGYCKGSHSSNNDTGMTETAQQEGKVVGSVAPAAWSWLYGFHPGAAHPMSSVLLRARWFSDADMDKERRGWDAGAIL